MFSFYHKHVAKSNDTPIDHNFKDSIGLRKLLLVEIADLLLMLALTSIASHCSLKPSLLMPQPLKETIHPL